MRLILDYPPNIVAIEVRFRTRGKPVFYAYGDAIYNPCGGVLTPSLVAHEEVHLLRQAGDPEGWWQRYIVDDEFRLFEEVLAHAMEYRALVEDSGNNRRSRRLAWAKTVARLRGPLYDYSPPLTVARAKALLDEALNGP